MEYLYLGKINQYRAEINHKWQILESDMLSCRESAGM